MERSVAASGGRKPDRIGGRTEADALVSADAPGAEHNDARRTAAGGDHVLGVPLGPARVDLDVVAGTGRDVLDLQRSHHRTAPLGFGVAADFRQTDRSCACKTRGTRGTRGGVWGV